MIIEALLFTVLAIVQALFAVLGAFVPGNVVGSVSGGVLVGYTFLNAFLPISETLAGILFLLGVYGWLFTYRVVREMWALVPIIGGH